jgi:Aminoglycoside-2''-adenylyltransferase
VSAELGRWEPYTPSEVATLLADAPFRWWIAGGWAHELAGGSPMHHRDVDVALLRPEHERLRDHLETWDLHVAHAGALTPWDGIAVDPPANAIWARERPDAPWRIDFKLELVDGADWIYRRDPTYRVPIAEIGRVTDAGIPYLRPEIAERYRSDSSPSSRRFAS